MNSKITYRQQYTRCGKQRCRKCREGAGHGPYWYAYWSEKGRTVSKYIGTHLPDDVEAAQQNKNKEVENLSNAGSPNAQAPVLRIYLLGQFRVERRIGTQWQPVDSRSWHRRRARALLGCLLSSPGRRLGREQIMDLLWPDLDIDVAANRLNGAVHELRQILEPDIERPAASRMLRLEHEILELADNSQIWVDAEAFEQLVKDAHSTSDDAHGEELLEEASSLYRGNYLLEELYSEWAASRRDALQRAWVGLLLHLADLRAKRGAIISAIQTLDRLRTAEPTNETALQRLMILLTHLDRRGEALQVYNQYVSMLQRDYEGEPLPETRKLYDALRQGQIPKEYSPHSSKPSTIQEKSTPVSPSPTRSSSLPSPSSPTIPFLRPSLQLGRHNQSPLIGREREQETMRQVMFSLESPADTEEQNSPLNDQHITATTRPKKPHFLLLLGEPGIGKTRLAEELSLEAYQRGWAVAWSRSYEQEGTIPYRPWTELLRMLLQGGDGIIEHLVTVQASGRNTTNSPAPFRLERLSILLPELATHASVPALRQTSSSPYEQERLHLWETTLGLLGTLSKIHPLLLVLDDLHWTDDSSIELLTYLTHHLQDQRVLIIATCRDAELPPTHRLRALISDLRREQGIVTLSILPLTQSQIGTLVSHLPSNAVQSIQTQAAGNPFFAEELARYADMHNEIELLDIADTEEPVEKIPGTRVTTQGFSGSKSREAPRNGSRALPEAIAAVLERRLSRLSNGCQALLSKAAVLGGSFELDQLLPMANEHTEDTILDFLEEALHAGLLTEEGTGAHITYHFWHPLIISHLYERLSAARRAQLHRRAAEALKATDAQEKVAATILHHLTKGGGEPAQIAFYAELAGNQAYSLAAYTEALQYYLQAVQALIIHPSMFINADISKRIRAITSQTIIKATSNDVEYLSRLLVLIAECSEVQGNFEDARYLYECILEVRTSEAFKKRALSQNPSALTHDQQEAQIQGLLWREIGKTWIGTGEYARAYECNKRGKAVMQQAGVTTGAAWASLHLQAGALLRLEGNYHEARRYLQEALEILEAIIPSSVLLENRNEKENFRFAHASSLSLTSTILPSPAKALQTRIERALAGDQMDLGDAHEKLGVVAASQGQLSDGLKHMEIALAIYEHNEVVTETARVCGNLGVAYLMKSEHDIAREYMRRSLELAERTGDLPNMAFVMLNLGDTEHRSGNLLEAEAWYKRSLTYAERIHDRDSLSYCYADLAAVQQDLGNLQEAETSLLKSLSISREMHNPRCIRYALVKVGGLRVLQAMLYFHQQDGVDPTLRATALRRSIFRARSTLQRAISLEELEAEAIIDGQHLLATLHMLINETTTAWQLSLQTLKKAQENESIRMIGRSYRLQAILSGMQEVYPQAEQYFEMALEVFRHHQLHLDYARTLHAYGEMLLKSSGISSPQSSPKVSEDEQKLQLQRALHYLQEAHTSCKKYHATIDIQWIEQLLVRFETGQTRYPPQVSRTPRIERKLERTLYDTERL